MPNIISAPAIGANASSMTIAALKSRTVESKTIPFVRDFCLIPNSVHSALSSGTAASASITSTSTTGHHSAAGTAAPAAAGTSWAAPDLQSSDHPPVAAVGGSAVSDDMLTSLRLSPPIRGQLQLPATGSDRGGSASSGTALDIPPLSLPASPPHALGGSIAASVSPRPDPALATLRNSSTPLDRRTASAPETSSDTSPIRSPRGQAAAAAGAPHVVIAPDKNVVEPTGKLTG